MGTTAQKLQAIVTAKADIAAAITEKGGTAPQKLSEFGNAIRALPSAGAAPALTAESVYKATRPTDWLHIPAPQLSGDIYMLILIPDGGSTLISFDGAAFSSFSAGTTENGEYQEIVALRTSADSDFSSGHFETELFAKDFLDTTLDGMHQAILYVKKGYPGQMVPQLYSGKVANQGIVEIAACAYGSSGYDSVVPGSNDINLALRSLRYIYYKATSITLNSPTRLGLFENCESLLCVRNNLGSSARNTTIERYFRNCNSLIVAPDTVVGSIRNIKNAFDGCLSLKSVPTIKFSTSGTADVVMESAFADCISIAEIPESVLTAIPTAQNRSMSHMLKNCISITALEGVNIYGMVAEKSPFEGCINLSRLTFFEAPEKTWEGIDFSVADCAFDRAGLVEMFGSLPTITASHSITITGNPGVSDLTDADKAIATEKNWTLVL